MLQRAASNAYSWWWSSHIRTKQSKWLEQSLQDMEEKVQSMLKLIEEDGDSFRKRAEMYYKRRPELINFVQESFRGYRSLAERYDKISKELQNANNTIATVFPEQVQFAMEEDDDDYDSPKVRKKVSLPQQPQQTSAPNVPKVPTRDLKGILTTASKKLQAKKAPKPSNPPPKSRPKSGLSKSEAVAEIDKLQKEILAMQTVKEFVKSSYESGLAKYWDIENKITEFQERVSGLQDEFGVTNVIEDDEARTLMVQTALKSCDEALTQLQEKQEKSTQEAKEECKKVESAREKLKTLRDKFLPDQKIEEKQTAKEESLKPEAVRQDVKPEVESVSQERQELDALREKIKEHFEVGNNESLTMTELAERIDELVSKVISLETSVSSQTALINRLKTDGDDLQTQIQNLEDDKANLIDDRNSLSKKIKDLEDKLSSLQALNHNVEDQNNDLNTHFNEARLSLGHLSEKLQNVKPEEGVEESPHKEEQSYVGTKTQKELEIYQDKPNPKVSSTISEDSKEDVSVDKPDAQDKKEEEKVTQSQSNNEADNAIEKKEEEKASQPQSNNEVDKTIEKKEDPKSLSKVDKDSSNKSAEVEEADKIDTQKGKDIQPPSQNVGEQKCLDKVDQDNSMRSEQLKEAAEGDQKDAETENDTQIAENRNFEKLEDNKSDEKVGEDNINAEMQELELDKEDCPNWQKLLTNGLEDREKVILTEYTAILRNYKDVKKKLTDAESKNRDNLFAIAQRDEEISSLRHKLNLPQESSHKDLQEENDQHAKPARVHSAMNDEEDEKMIEMDQPQSVSQVEEKFRTNIDALLDENLEFWLRFCTSFHQIQKFKTGFQDLQDEVSKLKEKEKEREKEKEKEKEKTSQVGSPVADIKSDIRPIYKHMSEIQAELAVWIEQSGLLKDELQRRFSSLCSIEEDIINALEAGAETEDMKFTSHEAAKFRGEVLNMKQENKKVRKELMGGLDHITILQLEIEKTLAQLDEEYDISGSKNNSRSQLRHSTSRSKIPLRSFIFGTKPKKKTSIFSCMHHRKYDIRSALPM